MEAGTSGADGSDVGPVVAFEGVSAVAPDGTPILHGVDLEVGVGRLTVLAGPSGAGKSTVLGWPTGWRSPRRVSCASTAPTLGDLDPRELRRRVGMVFQRPVLFAGTVRDNLHVADPGADEGALGAVLRAGGPQRRPARSGRRRPLRWRGPADVHRPHPAHRARGAPDGRAHLALDPANRRGIEVLARELAAEGLGMLWVTHDLAQAGRLGDQLVVLVDGRNADARRGRRATWRRRTDDEPRRER